MKSETYSIVVAVKEEEDNIIPFVEKIYECLFENAQDEHKPEKLLFVDGGSNDNTLKQIQTAASLFYKKRLLIEYIVEEKTRGTVAAQIVGARYCDSDFVVVMDGDLQHDPALIPEMVLASNNNSLVIASRRVEGGSNELSFFRQLVSSTARILVRVSIPRLMNCSDPLSGYFMIRRKMIADLKPYDGFFKLLFYVLARYPDIDKTEIPFIIGKRVKGYSKLTKKLSKLIFRYVTEVLVYRYVANIASTKVTLTFPYKLLMKIYNKVEWQE